MFGLGIRKRRFEAVIARVAGERAAQGAKVNEADRRKAIQAKLKEVEEKRAGLNKFRLSDAIIQAGMTISPPQFVLCSLAAGIGAGVAGWTVSPLVAVLAILTAGVAVPKLVLDFRTKSRLTRFVSLFADALDIIIRGVRSGLPLGECMHIIGRDSPEPVSGEFRMVTEGIRLGMTMEESLQRMSLRVPTSEVRFFGIVIGIQQQTGGNLAETLQKLSDVLRSRKRMKDKIQAMSSEAKASASIIGSLPIMVGGLLAVVAPDYIGLLFTTSTGNWILAGGVTVMGMGVLVMKGMINFEL